MEAAFFDLDKTVIAKATIVAYARPLRAEGLITRRLMLRAVWGHLVFTLFGADEARMVKIREQALRVTRGWDHAKVSRIVRDALIDVIEPIVYDEALELIREHKIAGRRVYLVSASPDEIVAPLAQFLGVHAAIATRARLDDDGRYTGEVEFYAYGPDKAVAVRAEAVTWGIDLAESYAYSDSVTDLPMLDAVGHPVAVNPDRELARAAKERGWEIREFAHPVPLRDRVPLPPPGPAAAAASVVLVAGAGGAAWWWARRTPGAAARVADVVGTARAALGSRRSRPNAARQARYTPAGSGLPISRAARASGPRRAASSPPRDRRRPSR